VGGSPNIFNAEQDKQVRITVLVGYNRHYRSRELSAATEEENEC